MRLPFFCAADRRQIAADVALVVGRDALQPADRDRLLLDPAAAAGRLARAVAGAAENAGKDVRFPVDRPGLAEAAVGDQPDVFRHRRVRRAGPLAIDNLMKIVGITDVGRLQLGFSCPTPHLPTGTFAGPRSADAARLSFDTGRGAALYRHSRHPSSLAIALLSHTGSAVATTCHGQGSRAYSRRLTGRRRQGLGSGGDVRRGPRYRPRAPRRGLSRKFRVRRSGRARPTASRP